MGIEVLKVLTSEILNFFFVIFIPYLVNMSFFKKLLLEIKMFDRLLIKL